MFKPTVDIAISILLHQNKVLVGWREEKQHQGNKYEFPGGKVEQNETPLAACRRETYEEVGVGLSDWHAFDVICHEYDDVIVNLYLFHAVVPSALLNEVQQPWTWYSREELLKLNFPNANHKIVARLYWPQHIKISEQIESIQHLHSEQLLYWRVQDQAEKILELADLNPQQYAKMIINTEIYAQLNQFQQNAISTIHLKQSQLMRFQPNDFILGKRYIAACHDLISIQKAQQLGCDAILLSPVLATETHPDSSAMGWEQFKFLSSQVDVPVYALGGMRVNDLAIAQNHGAYGIAGIRFL